MAKELAEAQSRARWAAAVVATALLALGSPAHAAPVARSLTELQVSLYGLQAGVEPANPIVPKQTASGLRVVVKAGGRTLSASEVARLLGGPFELQAELSGPGLGGVLALPRSGADAIPSPDPLVLTFPGLPHAGEYDISNLRLVRAGRPVLDVQPRHVTLRVIEQILVTSVVTRPLSLDEIRERGVVLDASAYLGFEFAITLKLESKPVQLRFPAVFDRQGVAVPMPLQPPPEPLRSVVSAPLLVPVLLRPAAFEADPDGAPPDYDLEGLPGYAGARIPSLLVIPGSVGYLKQFFSAQLMVGNGAPGGSGLVIRDVTGTLRLPPGADGQVGTADDPLALPELESGPQSAFVAVLGEGGTSELLPGEFGQAELTLRGDREGRHDIDFDIRAELDGLPVGPLRLEGSAHGVVLVRNAYFDVTFTVPTVVRADEEFSVFATVTNVGQGTGNDVKMTLDGSRLSGARLLSSETQTIASLPPGDAATLEYRFRSEVTGEVVASYLRFDTSGGVDVTGRLNFVLGVGERQVALSPDTLVLPAAVSALPPHVVRAAMRLLGQAWSAATATTLPSGVERPSTEAVFRKGLSVAEAGLRVELGQPLPEALRDLLVDLHTDGLDPGFDQALRETTAGRELDRVLGAALGPAVAGDALGYEEDAGRIAASGPPFVSAALENQGGGALPAELELRDGAGRVTGTGSRGVPGALVVALGASETAPRLGFMSALGAPPYTVEIAGAAPGVVGLSLTLPDATGGALHARVDGIAVAAGSRHRLLYDPAQAGALTLETDSAGDGVFEGRQPLSLLPLASEGPRLVSAVTIGPETLDGASPFGTYAALLFDRVVSDVDAADVARYEIVDNSVLAAKRQLSGRLVFVAFEQPEGPLVPTRLAVSGIHDERGTGGSRQEQLLGSRLLLPGAVVSGRVLEASGTPVADSLVTYLNTSAGHQGGRWDCRVTAESGVAAQRTDAAGRFAFRYVPQNPCGGPFRLETQDSTTGAVRGVKSYVRVDGQRLSLDLVLIGHGRVEGHVRHSAGAPAAGARVRVVSVIDSQIAVVTSTDAEGHYAVEGMTVGAVTVTAVLGANLGRGAGRLDVAGGSATVDVTLDGNVDITGVVRTLEHGVLTPVPGVDVVYYVGGTPLGLSVTDALGEYRLLGVPAGPYRLEAGVNQRDKTSLTGNSVAGQKLVQNLVIEILDYSSYATVSGSVKRFDGSPMPEAWVSDGVVAALADSLGQYHLPGVALAATPRTIQAVSPDGRRSGSTSVLVTQPGQVVSGADIQLSGLGAAAFQVLDSAGAPVSGASVGLQGNCLHPCGCRFSTTDSQGIARFADLPFGPVSARAVVQAPGASDTAVGSAVVNSEQVAGGGVIRLGGFGSVSGLVTNPGGLPAHGAAVELVGRRAVVGAGVCELQTVTVGTAYTDTAGEFHFDAVHVGPVSARASSLAFPRVVGAAGTIGAAGATERLELRLVDTLAGVLSGTVWLPDATAGAGPGVEVTASGPIPDVTVHTDAQGRYAFAQVLPAGGYLLTARDTRPGGTGSVVQERVWLQASQPTQLDLRLKAKGPVRVSVVDGAGVPVESALVRIKLTESAFPYRSYEGTIDGPGTSPLQFPAVFEGDFSVSASDNFARGGRASGAVPPQGLAVDVTVTLTTTGRVGGRFLWADGVTPLSLGTVRLYAGGRLIGQQTTASEGAIGSFAFDYVPAGPVSLSAEDPKSGRTGTASGSLSGEGQLLQLDVVAYAVGRVEGEVTLNDDPAPGASVALRSGPYSVHVTADGAGLYAVEGVPAGQVNATADLGGGFLAGRADGRIEAEGETLLLPIALRGAGAIEGTLLAAGGGPGAVSLVTLSGSGVHQTTTSDDQGRFRFDVVPEGSVTLVADALAGIDCDRRSLSVVGGQTVPATLQLRGVGAVEGTAQGSSGAVAGTLSLTGTAAGCQPRQWVLSLGPSGQFRIPELVAGPVSASFSTRAPGGPWLHASATGAVSPGETTTLSLQVEPSGSVHGSVRHDDGSPAIGSQVRVDAAGGRYALVPTGGDGTFLVEGIPAGAITIRVSDPARGGVALVSGLGVTAAATLEAGEIQLLETPLAVVSVAPPDGTLGASVSQVVQLTFNAPLASAGGIAVRAGGKALAFGSVLSPDARTVTLTPAGSWPDSAELTIEAGPWVIDVYGRRLPASHQARFRTLDLSPPRVIAVTPPDRAIQVDPAASVSVRFDEPIDTTLDLQPLLRLAGGPGPVAATVTAAAADTLLLTPDAPLAANTTYTLTVNGARDLLGHVQTTAFTSWFLTPDFEAPVLRLDNPPLAGFTRLKRPTIRITVEDALSGPDASQASLVLDGFPVAPVRSASQLSYVPVYDLADGPHAVEARAHDRAGNQGHLVASFSVDSQPPTGAGVTSPAPDQVVSGTVALTGTASDTASGVAYLSYLRDGQWIAEGAAASGFTASWNTTVSSDGPQLLTAQPVDVAGNSGPPSPAVRVIVDNQPLAIAFSQPAADFPVKTQVAVAASPSEPVAHVEFRAGSGPVVIDETAPYEAVLDVAAEPEGELELTVTAVGFAPETASATRRVLVDRTPPPVPSSVDAESSGDGSVLVVGQPGAVELAARVDVDNPASTAHNGRASFTDGSFALRLAGDSGDSISVVATDVAGNRSEPLTLTVAASDPADAAVPRDGLALWARSRLGVVLDLAGRVSRWTDSGPAGNDFVQPVTGQRPAVTTDPVSGRSALRFDGTDDFLQLSTRLAGSVRTLFAVVREDEGASSLGRSLLGDSSTLDFHGGAPYWWNWQPPYASTSRSIVEGRTWLNGAATDGRITARPTQLSVLCVEATSGVTASWLGKGIYSNPWKGAVAELLVYERALSIAERKAVEDYLALEYAPYVATAGAPRFEPNGQTFEESVTLSLSGATPGAVIRHTSDGTRPTAASTLYTDPFALTTTTTLRARSFRAGMKPSPVALASFTKKGDFAPTAVPGLALWLRGDAGVVADSAGRVEQWDDQSGQGNHLVQSTPERQPVLRPEAANDFPTLHFDGLDDVMTFTTRLDRSIRAVFAVVREDADAGSGPRALLGDTGSYDFYAAGTMWWYRINPPFVHTSPYILNGQTWVNDGVIDGTVTPRPKTLSVLSVLTTGGVSADRLSMEAFNQRWKGDVAELVIYTEPISNSQRKSIEDYLALKYQAYVPRAGAPEFTPNGKVFTGSVEVAIATPSYGGEIRYTTDGSEPTSGSALYGGPLTLTTTTTLRARAFREGMEPSAITLASFTSAADLPPPNVPGLALWVRGDAGVEVDAADRVSAWRDQSGSGNDLAQAAPGQQPLIRTAGGSGIPAVRFDGQDDVLKFTARFDKTIRAVFAVVREDEDAGTGPRALLGDASTYDFYAGGTNWWYRLNGPYVQTSAYILNGQTWVNGIAIDGIVTPRPRTLSVLSVTTTSGVSADRLSMESFGQRWKGDVAELIVYTQPISSSQRKSVEDYLALKYGAYVPRAGAPEFHPNGTSFTGSVEVQISSPTYGAEIRYTIDGSDPLESSALYTGPFVLTGTTTVRARAFRTGMSPSRVSTASFSDRGDFSPLEVPGLALWVNGGAGLELDAGDRASAWRDQSGQGNDLVQAVPWQQPLVHPAAAADLPAVRFDGQDDVLKFTARFDKTIRAVFAVVREDEDAGTGPRALLGDASSYDFYAGGTNWWYRLNGPYVQTSAYILNGQTWVNGVAVDGTVTPRPRTLSVLSITTTSGVSADRLSMESFGQRWKGDVAELLVFTQALTGAQRKSVEDYLALKYAAYVATAGAPEFTPDGGSFDSSLAVAIASGTPGATLRYSTDGSEPTESSPVYAEPLVLTATTVVRARAYHPAMNASPVTAAAFARGGPGSPASVPGKLLWVASDAGVVADGADRVSTWLDLSGRGNHLHPPSANAQPLLVPPTAGPLPVVRFDGVDDRFMFASRITNAQTAFWVVREDPAATSGYRFLLGDASSYDFHSGTNHEIWSSAYVDTAIRTGETRINGALVDGTATPRPTALSVVSLVATGPLEADSFSRDRTNLRSWWGDLAELVVFDRALAATERKAIEDYLALKHGLYVPVVSAPILTPLGSTTPDPVSVTIESDPGAEIRYTTDGSAPTATSALYTEALELTTRTVVRARGFRPGFQPSSISTGTFLDTETPLPAVLPGLALWVRSDAGITSDGGAVSAWADQSGNANDLVQTTAASRPQLVPGQANGLPVLRFDGTNDSLAFTTRLDGTIRAVFAVLRQSSPAATYRVLLGDTTKHDFSPGYSTWWSGSTSAAITGGETWVNGALVNGTTTNRPLSLSVLSLVTTAGVTADRLFAGKANSPWNGDIAELIVYTQPLTAAQRKSVEDYLALRYAAYAPVAGAPEFTPNGAAFTDSVDVSLGSPSPGAEIRYTTDGSEPDLGSPLYTGPITLTTTTLLQARAFHADMNPSPVSLAHFSLAGDLSPAAVPGLALWARADWGVASDGYGRVSLWRDLSGRGNDLQQSEPALQPSFVPDAQAGLPVVRFDGASDVLPFKSRLNTIRTVFWVVREDAAAPAGYRFLLGDASAYDFHSGSARQLWSGYTNAAILNGETRINGALVNGQTASRPTSLSVVSLVTTANVTADAFSRDRVYGRSWWGDLAELVVYDRPLAAAERKLVEDYLALKYALYVPTLAPPRISPNGSRVAAPVRVTLSAEPGAEIRYTTDGSEPTPGSQHYSAPLDFAAPTTLKARAFRAGSAPSPVASAAFLDTTTPAPLLVAGLKLWVKADAGVSGAGASVAHWADQSGNGNHLVQPTAASQPQLVAGEANGLPVVRFDGAGDFMSFTTRLTAIRSVFWVMRRSPSATPGYRMLLGDSSSYPFSSDAATKIWSTAYTSAAVLNGETRLNGALVNGTTTERPTTLALLSAVTTGEVAASTFSKDRGYDYSWWGDLAELLIFDRALAANERQSIEAYLAAKYALFTPTVAAPVIDPAGGALSGPRLVQIGSATPDAVVHYTLDDSEPTDASPVYDGPFEVTGEARVRARAYRAGWLPSAETVVTFYAHESVTPASLSGLAIWVRADAGLAPDGASWTDQGPAQNPLLQPSVFMRPTNVLDETSRMPLLRFDGVDDALLFSQRLTGIRTVFWVIRRSAAMTPGYRFLLGDVSSYDFCGDAAMKIWSSGYASAAVRNGQTRLDGAPVNGTVTDRPLDLAVITVVTTGNASADAFSRDRNIAGRSWWGDLAELVIFERALSASEVQAVEAYLAGRYGIGLAP